MKTAAEFFAGIGLMRLGLERAGRETVWADDIRPKKAAIHTTCHDPRYFHLGSIKHVADNEIPRGDVVSAGFPSGI